MNLEFVLVHKNAKKKKKPTNQTNNNNNNNKKEIVKDLTPARDIVNNLNICLYPHHSHCNTHVRSQLIVRESMACINSIFVDASSVDKLFFIILLTFRLWFFRDPEFLFKRSV